PVEGRRVPRPGERRGEGPALPDRRRLRLARDRRRIVRDRPARGDGGRDREGLLVPPREPKEIAGAVARLLRDDELREAMGAAGRQRAQEFSWERVTAKVDDYYGVVIRRLAARGDLPPAFHAAVPPSPRMPAPIEPVTTATLD